MSDEKVEITLLTSNKSGILSSIMVKGSKLGLMYRRNKVDKIDNDRSRMVVAFSGSLKGSKGELVDSFESHPEIFTVENISINGSSSGLGSTQSSAPAPVQSPAPTPAQSPVSQVQNAPSVNLNAVSLNAHDAITPESLMIAEKNLVDTLGPVAPILVKSAATKTKHVGDLFVLLADDLDGEEKHKFLSLVNGLD